MESNDADTKTKPGSASAKTKRDRSPNYPSLTFTDSLGKTEVLYRHEKKHPMAPDVAAAHLGYSNAKNGAFMSVISALRKYGLVEGVGGDVRVSDDASLLYIYPADAPERAAVASRLAMRPALFGEVLNKFPGGLPSDANLRAKLQHEWAFASGEAADAFIRALRDAVRVAALDGSGGGDETSDASSARESEFVPQPPHSAPATGGYNPPPAAPPPAHHAPGTPMEKHAWKLADGVWADITITGTMNRRALEKLKKYVDLIDFSDDETE
jgi:hypothetical protein